MTLDPSRDQPVVSHGGSGFSETEEAWDIYRLLVENSYDLVGELDVNRDFVYVNPSYSTSLGFEADEVLQKNVFDFIHPQDREKARRELQQQAGTTVFRFRHQSGAWKWFDCSFRQFGTALGSRTVLISRDISARKEAEIKFEVLASLGSRLSGTKTQVEAARVIAEAAQVLCPWDAFSVDLYDPLDDLIHPVLVIDEIDGAKKEILPEYESRAPSPFVRSVIQDGPQRTLRKGNDFEAGLRPFGDTSRASASLLFVPIAEAGATLGIVSIQSYRINAYSRSDLKLLQVLAGHCAGTLARIRAVDGLRETQARFEAFMENTPGAAWIKDEFGRYIYANHSIEALLRKKKPEILSKSDTDLLDPDAARELEREDQEVRKSGKPLRIQKSLLHDDQHRWFVCKFPFQSTKGSWLVGGLGFDISEQVQMLRSLQASEERFHTLFEVSPVGIGVVHAGTLLYTNVAYRRLFNLPPETAVSGRDFLQDLAPASRSELSDYFRGSTAAPASLPPTEVRGVRGDGAEFPCIVQVAPVELQEGRAHLVFILDISEKRALEAQLFQSQKMESIGRLAGGIAHDFANLLTAIQGHAARLERGTASSSMAGSSLDSIIRAAHKATELTRQLLAFSRKQTLQIVETDANAVITQTARMLERVIGEDISLRLHLAPLAPRILADQSLLEQLLLSLALTSRESMPSGGNLAVRTTYLPPGDRVLPPKWDKGGVCLRIEDTGRGIPREDLPQIFEPFFKTRTGTDTALRLATVYGIVQQHSATIEVQSDVGLGTRFEILFPAAALPAPPVAAAASPPWPSWERREDLILIVEDSADLRKLLREVLSDYGHQTLEAATYAAGLQLFEGTRDRISLVIADVCLGDGSGRDLVRHIRSVKPSLKAILTTGYDPHQALGKLNLQPGETFLPKPFQTEELLKAVDELLAAR
ncbi:MAG TPA: PAS domain S-box protein [Verrucomicrobiae bacterium]|nr:PAS domain S-box protein [Verrucomicrobiae bacterium]